MQYTLTRTVTPEECGWLDRTYEKDEIVYKYEGHTYGCVSNFGIACSVDGEIPFFEIPRDALKLIEK